MENDQRRRRFYRRSRRFATPSMSRIAAGDDKRTTDGCSYKAYPTSLRAVEAWTFAKMTKKSGFPPPSW